MRVRRSVDEEAYVLAVHTDLKAPVPEILQTREGSAPAENLTDAHQELVRGRSRTPHPSPGS